MANFITNQNIEIDYQIAGLGDRIFAYVIDSIIVGGYVFFIMLLSSGISQSAPESYIYFTIIFIAPVLFYSLLFEFFANGQTPGKRVRDIKVIRVNGGSPTFSGYLLRWIFRPIDTGIYGIVAIICISATEKGQRLGDIVAGTTVAKIPSQIKLDDIQGPAIENHEVTFPEVQRLSDQQVELIKEALRMNQVNYESEGIETLATKIQAFLSISTDLPAMKFLHTVLKDYEYLAQEEGKMFQTGE